MKIKSIERLKRRINEVKSKPFKKNTDDKLNKMGRLLNIIQSEYLPFGCAKMLASSPKEQKQINNVLTGDSLKTEIIEKIEKIIEMQKSILNNS